MITLEQFQTQFNRLQASFGLSKSNKIIDQWFGEFEKCEFVPFTRAMKNLQYGERFPNWKMLKEEYRNNAGEVDKQKYLGCELCRSGVVLFRGVDPRSGQVVDMAANCSICSNNRLMRMANIDPTRLTRDAMGTWRTPRAVEMDLADGMRVEDKYVGQVQPPMDVVKNVFGSADPARERKRYGSLKREEEREMREALL
jgi:hypothetical protein